MKKHYKVWVYDNQGGATVESKDYSIAVSEKENVIVLTIEQLRELWDAAADHEIENQNTPGPCKLKTPGFRTYLQSKGINI